MRFIQKFFQSKKLVENFIKENGMEAAVKEYGLHKLCRFKLLNQIQGTSLYLHNHIAYNKDGLYLGHETGVLNNVFDYNEFFETFDNGNIVLCLPNDNGVDTFGVFDKDGNQIVPYGIYDEYIILPKIIYFQTGDADPSVKALMIKRDGEIKKQEFMNIYHAESLERINTRPNGERICKAYYSDREEIICFSQQGEVIDFEVAKEENLKEDL